MILHAPTSLKEKRGLVKKAIARIRNRFPVSCAETADHDLWQRTGISVAMVAANETDIQRIFSQLEEDLQRSGQLELVDRDCEILHYS